MRHLALAIALLATSAGAWADDEAADPPSHSHWWLDLGEAASRWTWAAGASLTRTSFQDFQSLDDGSLTSSSSDRSSTGMRVFGSFGWRYVAIEVGYADVGKTTYAAQSDGSSFFWNAGPVSSSLEVDGFDASLVGRIPMGQAWTVVAKAGLVMYDTESELNGDSQCCGTGPFRSSDGDSELLLGLGAERAFGRWRLGLAYQLAKVSDGFFTDEVNLKSLALTTAYTWGPAASP